MTSTARHPAASVRRRFWTLVAIVFVGCALPAMADKGRGPHKRRAPLSQSALLDLPVREVTVFKDGHAFVLHEGLLPTVEGQVVINSLPTPILGTFWPYSGDPNVRLRGVVAGTRQVAARGRCGIFRMCCAPMSAAPRVYASTMVRITRR